MSTIQLKRGEFSNLPLLKYGEPAYISDLKQLYIGSGLENVPLGSFNIKMNPSTAYPVYSFKTAKFFLKTFAPKKFEKWKNTKGSEDYKKLSDIMKATFSNIVNEDLTYLLEKIQAPVFLIWGENDTATPLYMADIMEEKIPDCAETVYMGRTHYAFLEELSRTVAIVKTFFKE